MFDGPETFNGEKQIAEMLSSLNRVEAPTDFNTHVRARIASGRASESASASASAWATNLIRFGAFAAVAVAVAVGGYFALNVINTGQNDLPTVVEVQPQTPPHTEPLKTDVADPQSPQSSGAEIRADNEVPNSSSDAPKSTGASGPNTNAESDRPGGGSVDMSAPVASPKINPRGFLNPNTKPPSNAQGVDPNVRINVSQILEFIGVKATWAGDGWRVDSVEANNIGGRSGLKTGDVVQAINGQTVDKKTTFPAKFDGKSIRVRRDGASVQIDFKP